MTEVNKNHLENIYLPLAAIGNPVAKHMVEVAIGIKSEKTESQDKVLEYIKKHPEIYEIFGNTENIENDPIDEE